MKSKSKIKLDQPVFAVCNGTRGTWGVDNTEAEAKKNAQCRKTDKVTVYRITDIEKEPLTASQLDPRQNGGLSYSGYVVGDLLCPWFDNRGALVYNGTCHKQVVLESGWEQWWPLNDMGRAVPPYTERLVNAVKALVLLPGVNEFLVDNAFAELTTVVEAVQNAGYHAMK